MTPSFLSEQHIGFGVAGVVVLAFLIGTLGAASYFLGLFFGFISGNQRKQILQFFVKSPTIDPFPPENIRSLSFLTFCVFGGVIAAVFQMAQVDTLVPIQAFVLGATWPSVVNRMLSGNTGDFKALVDALPPPPASPTKSEVKL